MFTRCTLLLGHILFSLCWPGSHNTLPLQTAVQNLYSKFALYKEDMNLTHCCAITECFNVWMEFACHFKLRYQKSLSLLFTFQCYCKNQNKKTL